MFSSRSWELFGLGAVLDLAWGHSAALPRRDRLGDLLVAARSPEQTMVALEEILPKKYWVEISRLLVPFGKHVCTGTLPKCSTCPVLDMCRQVGVTSHR